MNANEQRAVDAVFQIFRSEDRAQISIEWVTLKYAQDSKRRRVLTDISHYLGNDRIVYSQKDQNLSKLQYIYWSFFPMSQ